MDIREGLLNGPGAYQAQLSNPFRTAREEKKKEQRVQKAEKGAQAYGTLLLGFLGRPKGVA